MTTPVSHAKASVTGKSSKPAAKPKLSLSLAGRSLPRGPVAQLARCSMPGKALQAVKAVAVAVQGDGRISGVAAGRIPGLI